MTMINGKGVSIVPGDWEQKDNKGMIKVKLVEGGVMPVYKTKAAASAEKAEGDFFKMGRFFDKEGKCLL